MTGLCNTRGGCPSGPTELGRVGGRAGGRYPLQMLAKLTLHSLVLATGLVAGCRPRAPGPTPALAGAAATLAASNLPEPIATPLAGDPMKATIHRLSNGMTVYLSTDRSEPRVHALVAVRAGGRHTPHHATGLAHYLEHMVLFKGSDELGTVDHAAEVPHLEAIRTLYQELPDAGTPEARTAVFAEIDEHTQAVARTSIPNEVIALYDTLGFKQTNAFTSDDQTHYVTNLPANRLEQWAEVESERLADPVFRLFYPELEAVYEEKNRGYDSAARQLREATVAALYPKHAYGTQSVLGKAEHLKTPAFDEMVGFFDRWYRPNNMAIVLVGDVDASVLPTLERAFGRLEPAPLVDPEPGDLVGPSGRVETTVTAPGDQMVRIAWRTVPATHKDAVVIEVLDRLLDDGLVGLLNVELELSGKAAWAGSRVESLREAGVILVEAAVRTDTTHDAVERLLRDAVAKLAAGATTQAQLDAAKLQIAVENTRRWELSSARAWRMLQAFTRYEPWEQVVTHTQRVDAVTLADVQAAAARYLGEDYVVGRIAKGTPDLKKIAKPVVTPLRFADAPRSAMASRIEQAEVKPIEPTFVELGADVSETKTDWGRLVHARNRDNDLFDLVVAVERGLRHDRLLCHAMTVMERSGTATASAAEFQNALYRLGAGVQISCNEDMVVFYLRGVDSHFDASVALFAEWLRAPALTEALRGETVKATLSQREGEIDHDASITAALRNTVYFGEDAAQRQQPSNAALAKAGVGTLKGALANVMQYEHTVAYYGPRPAKDVAAAAAFGPGSRKRGKPHVRDYRTISTTEVHVVDRASAQSTVHIVFSAKPTAPEGVAAANATGAYLARRAFDEIRGARALAYYVSAGIDVGDAEDDTALWAAVQAQPDKVSDAIPALMDLLKSKTAAPDPVRRAVAKVRERLRTDRVDPHGVPIYVAGWRDRGVSRDPNAVVWDGLDKVDEAAVSSLTQSLTEGPAFITIVGDASRMDMDALAKLGPVSLHEPATLFSYGPFE